MKKLVIKVRDADSISKYSINGMRIASLIMSKDYYEFKTQTKIADGIYEYHCFRLGRTPIPEIWPDEHRYLLEMLDDSGKWSHSYSVSLSDIEDRYEFYEKCHDMIEFLQYNKI